MYEEVSDDMGSQCVQGAKVFQENIPGRQVCQVSTGLTASQKYRDMSTAVPRPDSSVPWLYNTLSFYL